MTEIKLTCRLKCPECGYVSSHAMPTNACAFFLECPHCKVMLRPKKGDCCVFCSYGDTPCPPIQHGSPHCC
ncbi:MAG: GDCCVxC domain-containing (seleno)protein [Rhodothermales bacterium]